MGRYLLATPPLHSLRRQRGRADKWEQKCSTHRNNSTHPQPGCPHGRGVMAFDQARREPRPWEIGAPPTGSIKKGCANEVL